MENELDDFLVTKTTTQVYAVAAKDPIDAEAAVEKGEAELVQRNTQINSRPKPTTAQPQRQQQGPTLDQLTAAQEKARTTTRPQ